MSELDSGDFNLIELPSRERFNSLTPLLLGHKKMRHRNSNLGLEKEAFKLANRCQKLLSDSLRHKLSLSGF